MGVSFLKNAPFFNVQKTKWCFPEKWEKFSISQKTERIKTYENVKKFKFRCEWVNMFSQFLGSIFFLS